MLFTELNVRLRDVRVRPDGSLSLLTHNPQGRAARLRRCQ